MNGFEDWVRVFFVEHLHFLVNNLDVVLVINLLGNKQVEDDTQKACDCETGLHNQDDGI